MTIELARGQKRTRPNLLSYPQHFPDGTKENLTNTGQDS